MRRDQRVDRALRTPKRGVWTATVVILLVGAVVLVWAFSPSERRRRDIMERIELGDEATRVVELMGPPTECPAGSLAHLGDSFAEGWPPAAIDVTLQQLAEQTAERWVYALDPRERADCAPESGVTEIGVDRDQRVLWYIALTGKTRLQLPDEYTPAGAPGAP